MQLATKPETIIRQVSELSKIHSIPLLEFKDWLIDEEDSMLSNAANYLRVLKLFSNHIGNNKDFKDVTREQVLEFLNKRKNSIEDDPDKKWIRTWNDYLARLIGFYRWLYNQESNKQRSEWDTPEPFNSIKKKKNKRYSSYSSNDVWSQEEILLAVKYCDNIRDKAIITMCWDMAGRNHEIVKIKIKDVILKEKYAEVSTAWDTKTGTRTNPIILGFPYLRELLNTHPFSSEPNAYLMISRTSMKPITPDRLWAIANVLKKRIMQMIQCNEIKGDDSEKLEILLKKPWNPYLFGRHSSITEKSDMLNDSQLKQYAGWKPNSDRAKTYVHRKGKQVINPLLQEHGIIEKQERKPVRKECSKCNFINTTEATICSNCSFILDTRGWKYIKLEEEEKEKDLRLQLKILESRVKEHEKNNLELQKLRRELEDQKRSKKEEIKELVTSILSEDFPTLYKTQHNSS